MDDNKVVAALMMRVPEKVSWSLGFGDEEANGKDWRGFLEELAADENRPTTISLTFLLELKGETDAALDRGDQPEAEQ